MVKVNRPLEGHFRSGFCCRFPDLEGQCFSGKVTLTNACWGPRSLFRTIFHRTTVEKNMNRNGLKNGAPSLIGAAPA